VPAKLREQDFPAIYRAADNSSIQAQTRFLRATEYRLAGLLGAAFCGLFVWKSNASPVDWAGALAAVSFILALLAELFLLTNKPERTWYEGRAAAESVKTLSWRYMMDAEPFESGKSSHEADQLFLQQLEDVLGVLRELELVPQDIDGEQITSAMQLVRSATLLERKAIYEEERVCEQQGWYSRKAQWNRERANRWTRAMLAVETLGTIAAVLKTVGIIEVDLLGFAGAIVASMAAWLQTKQHRTLATAYAVTALELASVRTRIKHQALESDWARFVSDAEEAFSREHTLWKASRGMRSL
jgi:hypothetical protein